MTMFLDGLILEVSAESESREGIARWIGPIPYDLNPFRGELTPPCEGV